jgi:hypothetical protein
MMPRWSEAAIATTSVGYRYDRRQFGNKTLTIRTTDS